MFWRGIFYLISPDPAPPLLCSFYWLAQMLPELYTVLFARTPETQPQDKLRTQSEIKTPLIYEEGLSTIPERLFLGSEKEHPHKKV
jgi:hypothetical protein